jgi:hypothetical protein
MAAGQTVLPLTHRQVTADEATGVETIVGLLGG